ncbi:hypothetical protein ABT336_26220 [Micromonospora sp. NPDC000207]|uniref:hypothetical protein n=1 Tax=Micromonospora sp. NPDC000207 TaxID=3154246 RepID=UPI00331CBF29
MPPTQPTAWTDDDWIAFVSSFMNARNKGLTAGNLRGYTPIPRDERAIRALREWTDKESGQWLGPPNMPMTVRGLLKKDNFLDQGTSEFVRHDRDGNLQVSSNVYARAAHVYLNRCMQEGRAPRETDFQRVPVIVVRPRTFSRLWAKDPKNFKIKTRQYFSVPVGRRLFNPHQFDIDDHELRTWKRNGWTPPSNIHSNPRLAARQAWVAESDLTPLNYHNLQTFVPGPDRPSTFRPSTTPLYQETRSPWEQAPDEAAYERRLVAANPGLFQPQRPQPPQAQPVQPPTYSEYPTWSPPSYSESQQSRPSSATRTPTTPTSPVARTPTASPSPTARTPTAPPSPTIRPLSAPTAETLAAAEARVNGYSTRTGAPLGTTNSGRPVQRRPVPNPGNPNAGRGR